jgi:hypothetical protein
MQHGDSLMVKTALDSVSGLGGYGPDERTRLRRSLGDLESATFRASGYEGQVGPELTEKRSDHEPLSEG